MQRDTSGVCQSRFGGDLRRLLLGGCAAPDLDRLPQLLIGVWSQRLRKPLRVVLDQPAGGCHYAASASPVAAKSDRDGGWEAGEEAVHVGAGSSSEAIDALVVVADHAHVPAPAGDQLNQTLLGQVGVLVLVDEHPSKAVSQTLTHVPVLLQQPDGVPEQVVEVHDAVFAAA